jgi:cell division protein FtsL
MLPIIILALVLYIIYNKCNKYSPKKEFQRIIDEDNRLTKEKERIEREEYEINYKLEPL